MGPEPFCPTSLVMECVVEDAEMSLPVGKCKSFTEVYDLMEIWLLWSIEVFLTSGVLRDRARIAGAVRARDELGLWRIMKVRVFIAVNEAIE
jgi:hypothetical protein